MKHILLITGSILVLNGSLTAQNNVCFTLENNTSTTPGLTTFAKQVNVYGVMIYGETGVSDEKIMHAAAVTAELLDNNEDGVIDDPVLLAELVSNEASVPVFASEGSAAENDLFSNYQGNGIGAVLYNGEVDPVNTGHWGDDASVEEILHTINSVGHTNIYPNAFSISPNSSLLTAAMDTARGGQFLTIPSPYPADAWYHYNDYTCDYQCMAIEYLYWAIVTNMGILDDPATCAGIANEWEPCSQSLLQSTDTLVYNLITNSQYKLPQIAPDGNYCPPGLSTNNIENNIFASLYPNPVKNVLNVNLNKNFNGTISILNIRAKVLVQVELSKNNLLDISGLSNGVYFLRIETDKGLITKKFTVI